MYIYIYICVCVCVCIAKKKGGAGRAGGGLTQRRRTVERAPGARGVKPAVGAAAAHLAVDDDAGVPGPVALVAVLAGDGGQLAGNMGKEGLNVATAAEVQHLLGPALLGQPHAGLARQPLRQRALDDHRAVPGLLRQHLRRRRRRRVRVVHRVRASAAPDDASEVWVLVRVLHTAGQDAGGRQVELLLLLMLGLGCCGCCCCGGLWVEISMVRVLVLELELVLLILVGVMVVVVVVVVVMVVVMVVVVLDAAVDGVRLELRVLVGDGVRSGRSAAGTTAGGRHGLGDFARSAANGRLDALHC